MGFNLSGQSSRKIQKNSATWPVRKTTFQAPFIAQISVDFSFIPLKKSRKYI
jgi:hypothetical protein